MALPRISRDQIRRPLIKVKSDMLIRVRTYSYKSEIINFRRRIGSFLPFFFFLSPMRCFRERKICMRAASGGNIVRSDGQDGRIVWHGRRVGRGTLVKIEQKSKNRREITRQSRTFNLQILHRSWNRNEAKLFSTTTRNKYTISDFKTFLYYIFLFILFYSFVGRLLYEFFELPTPGNPVYGTSNHIFLP